MFQDREATGKWAILENERWINGFNVVDDDNVAPAHSDVGCIEVCFTRTLGCIPYDQPAESFGPLEVTALHEKSKKMSLHCVGYTCFLFKSSNMLICGSWFQSRWCSQKNQGSLEIYSLWHIGLREIQILLSKTWYVVTLRVSATPLLISSFIARHITGSRNCPIARDHACLPSAVGVNQTWIWK